MGGVGYRGVHDCSSNETNRGRRLTDFEGGQRNALIVDTLLAAFGFVGLT